MTEAELRGLVRDAVARHLAQRPSASPAAATLTAGALVPAPPPRHMPPAASAWQQHSSHHLYVSLANVDGACVIEPSVPCDHCGYCKSHGH